VVSGLEHHANIVPWQLAGATLRIVPLDDDGAVRWDALDAVLGPRTRVVAVTHRSNVTAAVTPLARVVAAARAVGAAVLVDGAQAVPHAAVDVQAIGCDFYAFSGHKAYGPTGIGALYGRTERLAALPPWQGGGEMIARVTFEGSTFQGPPQRFEAGTPNVAGAVGLAAALDWLAGLDRAAACAHERRLAERAAAGLARIDGVRVWRGENLVSFHVDGAHPHDVGTVLDQLGVAVRTGHLCAQPFMRRMGVSGLTRASFAAYSMEDEVERLVAGVAEAVRVLR
jgi:cysteine desulfurase/selenocysteine lyase